MKNRTKIPFAVFIISVLLIISGIVIATIGFQGGGRLNVRNIRFGPLNTLTWSDSGTSSSDKNTYTSDHDVTSISVDSSIASIKLVQGEKFSIKTKNISSSDIDFSDNKGNIHFDSNNDDWNFSFGFTDNDREIVVTVPKTCKEIDVSGNIGDIKAENISSEILNLEMDTGSIKVENTTFKDGNVKVNVGDFKMDGSFTSSLKAKIDIGSIRLTLAGSVDDYSYDLDTDIGDARVNDESHGSTNKNNHKTPTLEARVNVGDIRVNFK